MYESNATNIDADVWKDQAFPIPPRSKFYHLEPRGVGTPYVESLSGYAARLAQAHLVTPNALMKEIIPLAVTLRMMPHNYSVAHRAINGSGVTASNFAKALELLTGRRDLASTTMVIWVDVIPDHSLIRTKRAWYPKCYQGWRERDEVVYDPLLWTLQAVITCPLHQIPLILSCPHCKTHILHLASRSRPGFCTSCKEWLGSSIEDTSSDNFPETGDDAQWQLWKAESIGVLLANASSIAVPTRQQVARSLRYCINNFSRGRTSLFASQVEIPLKSVRGWLSGERAPILQAILQITYRVGVQLLPFLCGSSEIGDDSLKEVVEGNSSNAPKSKPALLSHDEVKRTLVSAALSDPPEPLQAFVRLTGWSRVKLQNHFPELCATVLTRYDDYYYQRIDEVKALAVLRAALIESPPPSIVMIARRIGCNGVSLRCRFPDITRDLVSRYKSYWRNTDWQVVEASLKEALCNYPPSSMSKTARALGLPERGARMRFPELTRAIAQRFKKYVKARIETRKEQLRQEILRAIAELNSEGIYPSVKRVAARVKASRNAREIHLTLGAIKLKLKSNLDS